MVEPALTTVAQPVAEMGTWAVERISAALASPRGRPRPARRPTPTIRSWSRCPAGWSCARARRRRTHPREPRDEPRGESATTSSDRGPGAVERSRCKGGGFRKMIASPMASSPQHDQPCPDDAQRRRVRGRMTSWPTRHEAHLAAHAGAFGGAVLSRTTSRQGISHDRSSLSVASPVSVGPSGDASAAMIRSTAQVPSRPPAARPSSARARPSAPAARRRSRSRSGRGDLQPGGPGGLERTGRHEVVVADDCGRPRPAPAAPPWRARPTRSHHRNGRREVALRDPGCGQGIQDAQVPIGRGRAVRRPGDLGQPAVAQPSRCSAASRRSRPADRIAGRTLGRPARHEHDLDRRPESQSTWRW